MYSCTYEPRLRLVTLGVRALVAAQHVLLLRDRAPTAGIRTGRRASLRGAAPRAPRRSPPSLTFARERERVASSRPMNDPFDASAPRNGASGFCEISSSRALSIREIEALHQVAAVVADRLRLLERQLEDELDVGALSLPCPTRSRSAAPCSAAPVIVGRLVGFTALGIPAKCFLICASIAAGSKSPTAITACRSGRYHVL